MVSSSVAGGPAVGSSVVGESTVGAQVDRLVALGVPALAGLSEARFRALAESLPGASDGSVVVVHPSLVPAAALTGLLTRDGKPGFVVVDMDDVHEFAPIDEVTVPEHPLYLIDAVQRGDELANWTPQEALPDILGRGRRPLTINEGISWLLQQPEQLEPNHCFMTIGSRKRKGNGLDTRTPAIWISGGTGRDGRDNRGAPKLGWCWAGNRHTWLGFASAAA